MPGLVGLAFAQLVVLAPLHISFALAGAFLIVPDFVGLASALFLSEAPDFV